MPLHGERGEEERGEEGRGGDEDPRAYLGGQPGAPEVGRLLVPPLTLQGATRLD